MSKLNMYAEVPTSLIREVNAKLSGRSVVRWEQVHEKWLVFLEESVLVARPYHSELEQHWVVVEIAPYAERVLAAM